MKDRGWVLLSVATGTFIVTFDGAAVQMALPMLHDQLGAGIDEVQWTMTSYLLVSAAALLPSGHAGDTRGHGQVWLGGIGVFVAASILCASMPGLWWLIGARALQGLGAAMVTANAAPILIAAFPDEQGRALGMGSLAIALGLVAGPPVGALLAHAVSWRLIFAVAPPFGLFAWWGLRRRLPPRTQRRDPLHVADTLLSAAGLVGLLVALTFGRRLGWSPAILALVGGGAACLIAFFYRQAREPSPLLDLSLFRRRVFLSGALATLLAYTALFSLTVAMPFFLVIGQRRGLPAAGLIVGAVPLSLSLVAPFAGALADRWGSRGICTLALLSAACGMALLSRANPYSGLGLMLPSLSLVGAGIGGFQAPNDAGALGSLPRQRMAVAAATLGAMRQLGMTLGGAIAATLIDRGVAHAHGSEAARVAEGVRLAITVGAVVAGAAAAAASMRPGRPRLFTPAVR